MNLNSNHEKTIYAEAYKNSYCHILISPWMDKSKLSSTVRQESHSTYISAKERPPIQSVVIDPQQTTYPQAVKLMQQSSE
jgi:hypothetical protein